MCSRYLVACVTMLSRINATHRSVTQKCDRFDYLRKMVKKDWILVKQKLAYLYAEIVIDMLTQIEK